VAVGLILAGTPTYAQQDGRAEVEEITVTAQKREERLQTAPLSVTALTSAAIEEKGINTVIDVAEFTPNLHIHPNAGGNTGSTINIRGAITSDPIITLEPTVGIYQDGVYIGKSVGSAFDFADAERIEVLRGPQGTLYGRNTIGGAINLVGRKPGDELTAQTKVIGGNYETFENVSTLNVPLLGENGVAENEGLGKINARATVSYRVRNKGFAENDGTGSDDFDDLNRFGTRLAARWQPVDRFTLDYAFDYHRSREDTSAFQLTHVRPNAPTNFIPGFEAFDDAARTNRVDSIANNNVANIDGSDSDLENDLDVRGHAVTGAVDLGEIGALGQITLKSITGFRNFEQFEVQDLDGTSFHVSDFSLQVDHDQSTEEVQIVGSTWENRINYVAGFFFLDEEGGENNGQAFFAPATRIRSINRFDNQSYAPYGQATVTLPFWEDRISLTGGVRYTYEKKDQSRIFDCLSSAGADPCFGVDLNGDGVPDIDAADFSAQADKSFDDVSWMGNPAIQWTDSFMTYYRAARGFKSGGFNGRATAAALFNDPYKDEKLTSHEVGFKSQWFDNRVRLNAAGFYNKYKDLQVTVFRADPQLGPVTTVQNAADAEIYGAEVEIVAVPIEGVDVRVGYGLLQPDYNEFEEDDPANPGQTVDVSEERGFVLAPDHSITAGITYTAPPTDRGTFAIGVDAYYQDGVKFATKDFQDNRQNSYVLFNTRAQLASIPLEHGEVDVALFCKNLFDKKYKDFGIDFGQLGYAGNTYGDPRTFGFEAIYRWGGES
jgi:iron complex outermembrane receptor protein